MNRIRFIGLMMSLIILAPLNLLGEKLRYTTDREQSLGQIGFEAEMVDYRDDLTRVYGSIIGLPHTSGRIDTLILVMPDNRRFESTDIDGVDMARWFQWEDSMKIPVEIDFPPLQPADRLTFRLTGPKGASQWSIKRID